MSPSRRLLVLLAVAGAVPLVEAAILVRIGFVSPRALAPQATAVWPYDTYHDLRWVFVYHNSWLTFALGLLAAIALRGALSAILVRLAWPAEVPRPPLGELLRRNLGIAALTALIVAPFAAMSFAASAVALSWFVFVSLGPMIVIAPFLQRMSVGPGGWRGLPSAELFGWSLLDLVVLSVAGGLVWSAGSGWTPVVALGAGMVNGLLWNRTVRAALIPQHVRLARAPVTPIVVVLAMAAPLVVQILQAPPTGTTDTFDPPIFDRPLAASVPYAVILLAGHDSAYDGREAADPRVRRFSYAGIDADGRPLPYSSRSTRQSLTRSALLLAAQIDVLHRRTGRPIALIGESEGAMVARTYLRDRPGSPVQVLMMFSPLARPGRVYYPPPEANSGWGIGTGWLLRGLFGVINLVSASDHTPDEPFIRSLIDDAPFYRYRTMCPVPGVRVIAFLPTVTAVEAPPGPYTGIPVIEVPAFHASFLGRATVSNEMVDFLSGQNLERPRREYGVMQRLGSAWQAPPLTITLNPVWRERLPPGQGSFLQQRLCA
ncbi:hypothetical protein [Micromonospora endophytica]|uniref:Uncharacterized protein n=1 Tax=Micromonospora endophytica TaxID=515350 RepID=A0A2W2CJE2_9ACTN|nr:hypothetical protein [Micromonospora endophytica]PZF91808.1 hypothetical protein C1I93_20680 [Micromonospora endophytica]RIW44385.1 hypothetical protein D3H59_18090 [Micromonospora endophytica]BCJ62413.1 hypothetical protein Jiend_58350 [Micromonospora endophytica]